MTVIDRARVIVAPSYSLISTIKLLTWDTGLPTVLDYRKVLLDAQRYLCAYCQCPIVLDELGHREIEHIVPKSRAPVKKYDPKKAESAAMDNRRHTPGYPLFMYHPDNLAISCKHCNAAKGSFDPTLNRKKTPKKYPNKAGAFAWVHPHFDRYDDHIQIREGFLYTAVKGGRGKYVIKACGLDKTIGLSDRVLDAMVLRSEDMTVALLQIGLSRFNLNLRDSAVMLREIFKKGNVDDIESCLRELRGAKGTDRISEILVAFKAVIGTGGPVLAP